MSSLDSGAMPQAARICSRVMAPGRSSTGTPRVQSTMVLSMPTSHGPPSSTSSSAPSSSCTCRAVVGLTRPKRLALGAATPHTGGPPWASLSPGAAQASSRAWATGWAGQRSPTLSCPPVAALATPGRRGRMSVSGPGQKASTSFCAKPGTSLAKCAMPSALATCTIRGWSLGRPLATKICATAASLLASAARPYTVSVGRPSSAPLRTARAAAAMDAGWVPSRIMVRTVRCPAGPPPAGQWHVLLRGWLR